MQITTFCSTHYASREATVTADCRLAEGYYSRGSHSYCMLTTTSIQDIDAPSCSSDHTRRKTSFSAVLWGRYYFFPISDIRGRSDQPVILVNYVSSLNAEQKSPTLRLSHPCRSLVSNVSTVFHPLMRSKSLQPLMRSKSLQSFD